MIPSSVPPLIGKLVLQAMDPPTCGPVQGVGDVFGWLLCQADTYASLIVALATAAAAGVAWQAHRREERREREREAANDARIEGLAYALLHEMDLWQWDPGLPGPPVYPTVDERAKYALRAVPSMKEQFQEMLALAPDASTEQKEQVQLATTAFYTCVGWLRYVSRGERVPRQPDGSKWSGGESDFASLDRLMEDAQEHREDATLHLVKASGSLLEVDRDRIDLSPPTTVE